ncbi:MAG: Cephalosporin hydroxylase [Actinomycetia bacterium]|nr:Cephalosporin hydroxylase [Actinomycetes bacterium]
MTDQAPRVGRTFSATVDGVEQEFDLYDPAAMPVLAELWTRAGWQNRLSYEVTWLGIPMIQVPEDIVMLQELVWKIRPTVVVECGVAHGGALVFYAGMLELLGHGRVIGVDVEIRKYNRLAIESHPLSDRIRLIEGSSTAPDILDQVRAEIRSDDVVLVLLDSNHTAEHVRAELEAYAPMVTPGSYVVVFDSVMTLVHDAPNGKPTWTDDNPVTAVNGFLGTHPDFERDASYERLQVTYCRGGFLRRRHA